MGRWKLWHLATVVAVVAMLMAISRELFLQLVGIGMISTISLPAIWAGTVWDRYLKRCGETGQQPNLLVGQVTFRAAWFGGTLGLYWMGLIFGLVYLLA